MAERYQSQLVSAQPVQSTQPQLFQSLSQRLSAFAGQTQDELDRQMQKKAKEKGLIDAQGKTAITLRDGNTIADEAWNEGAITSHISAIKLDVDENLTRIAGESTRDPVGYEIKAKAYSKGLLQGVPPGLAPAVQDELTGIMLNSKRKIQADLASYQRDEQAAQTNTAIELYRVDAENKAKEGDIESATDSQLKAMELTNGLVRSGMMTFQAAETQKNKITREIEDQAIYGEFGRQLNQGRAVKFLKQFKEVKELGDRDPTYRKKMEDEMLGMIKKSHEIEDDAQARIDKARRERHRKGLQDAITFDLQGVLTTEDLVQMVQDDILSPNDANKLKQSASLDGPEYSNPQDVNHIRANPLAVDEMEIMASPYISNDDKGKLVEERRKLVEDKSNWRNTQNGREGARRINQAFGIIAGIDTRITRDKAQRAGNVLTRYFNEIESLPVEQREIKSTEIADKLVKEVSQEQQNIELETAQEKLSSMPYSTAQEIDEADLGAEETRVMKTQLERAQRQVKRLGGQID